MSNKKELVSERDLYEWYNETESMFGFWMSYVAKKMNQRHEERMKEGLLDFYNWYLGDNPKYRDKGHEIVNDYLNQQSDER